MIQPNTEPLRCLILGDICWDISTFLEKSLRANPEDSTVPLYRLVSEVRTHGMAYNYARALGLLCDKLDVQLHTSTSSIRKHRTFLRGRDRLGQPLDYKYLHRVDLDSVLDPLGYDPRAEISDFIVVADYAKGSVTPELVSKLPKPATIYVDTKAKDLTHLAGCTVKMNDDEFKATTKFHRFLDRIIHTKGADGAELIYPNDYTRNIKVPGSGKEAVNVSGAGDVFFATFIACEQYHGFDEYTSLKYATVAAGISIQHHVTYFPTMKEINAAI